MPEQRSRPRDSRVIALANQKGGTGKTTTTVNLSIGLARLGKKVLLIDADPQSDLTTCLGWQDQDSLQTTLATVMGKIIRDEPFTADEGILHHSEGVDLMPANIELSDLEATLVNAMSREITLRTHLCQRSKEKLRRSAHRLYAVPGYDYDQRPGCGGQRDYPGAGSLSARQGHDPAYQKHHKGKKTD